MTKKDLQQLSVEQLLKLNNEQVEWSTKNEGFVAMTIEYAIKWKNKYKEYPTMDQSYLYLNTTTNVELMKEAFDAKEIDVNPNDAYIVYDGFDKELYSISYKDLIDYMDYDENEDDLLI